jgi:hypothetical protein
MKPASEAGLEKKMQIYETDTIRHHFYAEQCTPIFGLLKARGRLGSR